MQREQSECTAAIQFARQHGIRQHMVDAILLIRYIVTSPFAVVVWIRWVYDTPIYLLCQYVYRNLFCFFSYSQNYRIIVNTFVRFAALCLIKLLCTAPHRYILLFLYRIQIRHLHSALEKSRLCAIITGGAECPIHQLFPEWLVDVNESQLPEGSRQLPLQLMNWMQAFLNICWVNCSGLFQKRERDN